MKILGIDYGRRKVGLAVGDTETKIVEPLCTDRNLKFLIFNPSTGSGQVFQTIINDQNIKKTIIGVTGGKIDNEIRKFGERLQEETKVPVEYFDETLTTQDAQKLLIESGSKRKLRKQKEDAVAAALMLQYYLEARLR